MIVVVVLAALVGPKGPTGPPDPIAGGRKSPAGMAVPLAVRPAVAQPAGPETFIILVFPVILIVALLLVPFVSNRGERAPSRRPVAVLAVIVIYTVLGVLTVPGRHRALVAGDDGLERRSDPGRHGRRAAPRCNCKGPSCFRTRTAGTVMRWRASAARRGPDLTTVGIAPDARSAHRQISNGTPGGGNMPAYGKQMNPAEMTALVEFLVSLRPAGQPPAVRRLFVPQNVEAMSPTLDALPAILAVRALALRYALR